MQSQDEKGNVVGLYNVEELSSVMGARDLAEKIKAAEARGAVSHTIGKLPARLHRFTLLGMLYEVTFVDHKRAKIQAKMVDGSETMIDSGAEVAGELGEKETSLFERCRDLARATVQENGVPGDHISWIQPGELPDVMFPAGKVMKVAVTWVDEAEIIPPK